MSSANVPWPCPICAELIDVGLQDCPHCGTSADWMDLMRALDFSIRQFHYWHLTGGLDKTEYRAIVDASRIRREGMTLPEQKQRGQAGATDCIAPIAVELLVVLEADQAERPFLRPVRRDARRRRGATAEVQHISAERNRRSRQGRANRRKESPGACSRSGPHPGQYSRAPGSGQAKVSLRSVIADEGQNKDSAFHPAAR